MIFVVLLYFFMQNNYPDELFPVVDEEGNEISLAPRSICHNGKSKLLHPVVHFHLFNGKGELYLQKRAMTKDLLPGKWDTSVGGHISPGESVENALKREVFEELGLKEFNWHFVKKYIWESTRERELVYSFTGNSVESPVINKDEIDEGTFWTVQEIADNIFRDLFTPNFIHEFNTILPISGLKF
jgi:isopentenyldiphosphate isomerase